MVVFATGHEDPSKDQTSVDYAALAHVVKAGGTLCVYMGSVHLEAISTKLLDEGVEPDTPAAIIQWGCTPLQKTVVSSLQKLPRDAAQAGIAAPTIIVVGVVAALDESPNRFFWIPRNGC